MAHGGTTDVLRRYYGGATEVPYGRARDTSGGGRTRGAASDGQPKIGSVNETAEVGQGRDGVAVQRQVLQPGTIATGSLAARALGPMPLGIDPMPFGIIRDESQRDSAPKPRLRAASYPGKSGWCRPTGLWSDGGEGTQLQIVTFGTSFDAKWHYRWG